MMTKLYPLCFKDFITMASYPPVNDVQKDFTKTNWERISAINALLALRQTRMLQQDLMRAKVCSL